MLAGVSPDGETMIQIDTEATTKPRPHPRRWVPTTSFQSALTSSTPRR